MARQRFTGHSCVECGADIQQRGEVFCNRCLADPIVCRQNEPCAPIEDHGDPSDDVELALMGNSAALARVPRQTRWNFRD